MKKLTILLLFFSTTAFADFNITIQSDSEIEAAAITTYQAQIDKRWCTKEINDKGGKRKVFKKYINTKTQQNGAVYIPNFEDSFLNCDYTLVGLDFKFNIPGRAKASGSLLVQVVNEIMPSIDIYCEEFMYGPNGDEPTIRCSGARRVLVDENGNGLIRIHKVD